MKSPDIKIRRVEHIAALKPASPKEELIHATGGEKMTVLTRPKLPVEAIKIGSTEIVLNSFSPKPKTHEDIPQAGTERRFTTTCCDNDWTRGDGSCPPGAC